MGPQDSLTAQYKDYNHCPGAAWLVAAVSPTLEVAGSIPGPQTGRVWGAADQYFSPTLMFLSLTPSPLSLKINEQHVLEWK